MGISKRFASEDFVTTQINLIEKEIDAVSTEINNIDIPANVSDLNNDSGFITTTVSNLTNYYLKSETYSQEEVNAKLSAIPKFAIQPVDTLPTSDISVTTVYLLKSGEESQNLYTEYIYVNNTWEYLGAQTVDLSGYALKSDVPTKLSDLTNDSGFITKNVSDLVNYYKKTEVYSKNEIDAKKYLTEHQDLSVYAKTSQIPTKVSQLTNDSKFLTAIPNEYVTESELVGKGYLTQHQDLSSYAKKSTTLAGYGITDAATKTELNKLDNEKIGQTELTNEVASALQTAKDSGTFDGQDGDDGVSCTHSWNGTTLTITSASGSSSANLKGDKGDKGDKGVSGVYVGSGDMPSGYNIQIDPEGNADYGDLVTREEFGRLEETIADHYTKTESDNKYQPKGDYALRSEIPSVSEAPVKSVNGKTGAVVLSASDVGATTEAWVNAQIDTLKAQGIQQVPLFASKIEECTDKTKLYVLPDGFLYACFKETVTTEGGTVPNFTNLLTDPRTIIKTGKRFSTSSVAWKDVTGGTSYLVPIPTGSVTLRVRNYTHAGYEAVYGFTDENTYKATLSSSGMGTSTGEKTVTFNNSASNYAVFCSKPESVEIITVNEEIKYTTTAGGTETIETWKSTGHAFVPADYEDTIITIQNELAGLKAEQTTLKKALEDVQAYSVGEVFAPSPQLPANSTSGSDINADSCSAQDIYNYIDAVMADYPNYIAKETLGKDQSGSYDVCRYILSKHYYKAWQRQNYPKMYAWVNGSTTIYSVSVSPRIGDTLYTTKYIGTSKGTVTAVDNANDSRTVGGVVYTRDKSKDVEPTLVYTTIVDTDAYDNNGTDEDVGHKVYNDSLGETTTISSVSGNTITGANGITYVRYPMGDRNSDFEKFVVMTIGSNEHGPALDPRDGAIICARLIKDLAECRNANNLFLNHIKNNVMLIFIPVINPYGFTLGTSSPHGDGYYNVNGVNINRNYDCVGFGVDTAGNHYAGEYGGSEVETQYFMNTISEPNSDVVISIHILGVNNDNMCHYQGNGFDESKIKKIAEVMKMNYNLNFASYGTAPLTTTAKSPTYITKAGAKGGIIEFQNRIGGSGTRHTERAMEGCYTLLLESMHMWLTDLE